MSVPHTGQLTASVAGLVLHFDGDTWRPEDQEAQELAESLTWHTSLRPKQHWDIKSLAEAVLKDAGLAGRSSILSSESDEWEDELPGGAVD